MHRATGGKKKTAVVEFVTVLKNHSKLGATSQSQVVLDITPKELKQKFDKKQDFVLLDVRTKGEREIAKINLAIWIPMDEIEARYKELDKKKDIIVHCHHGMRSEKVAAFLKDKGFNAKSLKGGIDAWSKEVDNAVPQY